MAEKHPEWIDDTLAPLLKKPPRWPVATAERSRAQQHRRLLIIIGIMVGSLIVIFNAMLIGFKAPLPLGDWLIVTVAVPLGAGLLVYLLLYWTVVSGRRDDADHPRKYYADARGLSIEHANGQRIGGRWSEWRYEGYVYGTVKNNRFVKGIDLSLNGQRIDIDFLRVPKSQWLARAIVQGLANPS